MALAPSIAEIEALAAEAFAALPDEVRRACSQVLVRVEEIADPETLARMEITNPYELTGLYDGVPLTEKSISDVATEPDCVWLYRRAILDEWAERGDVTLRDLVAHILVHELAHHLGWSDDDIATVDRWWE